MKMKSIRRTLLLETMEKVLTYKGWEYEVNDGELYFIWGNHEPDTRHMTDDEVLDLLRDLVEYELY